MLKIRLVAKKRDVSHLDKADKILLVFLLAILWRCRGPSNSEALRLTSVQSSLFLQR
jgi:hypothetical protein